MSQYYQLTSLEEIFRLYPNLQVENVDSVQYMVQDDKIIQYTDAQGQQTLATIDNTNMMFRQSPSSTQQGLFVIEAVESQPLETNRANNSSDQLQTPGEQLNPVGQTSHKIVESQQGLIVKQMDQTGTELFIQKEVPNNENKSQCIQQMDQNKSQVMNQQPQYVIHPIQANLVQVDSSKQQSNSLQTQFISQQQEINNAIKGFTTEKINKNELQQLPVRQLEGNKGAFVGQINTTNNQQQFVMQPIETSYHKAVVELGTQDRQLIMQQVDGAKQNSFIVQQLGSNNQFSNQILVNQLKTHKNQHALIQNIQFTQKDSQAVKLQNVENPQFIMQKLDGNKQQQAHYQMQHFIVPQGDRQQPKVVVQRLEINKQMASAPLIVQQFQPVTSNQGTQFVVQQLDLNKQQHLLPYLFSPTTKQCASTETVQGAGSGKVEANVSHSAEQKYKSIEKEERLVVQFVNNQEVLKSANSEGNNKQEKRVGTVSAGQEIKSLSQMPREQVINRANQQSQTGEANERQANIQTGQSQTHPQRQFIHQEIVQQNHVQRSLQEGVPQSELYTKAMTAENCQTVSICGEQHKGEQTVERGQNLQSSMPLRQASQFVHSDNVESDNSPKNKQETSTQLDKAGSGIVSMQPQVSAANLPQCRRITLKQNESEYPAGVFIIPRTDNQMFIRQYQQGFRFQGTQTVSNAVVKQISVDNKTTQSNDKSSQTGDLPPQNVVVQQEPQILMSAVCLDSQKSSNLTALNQQKAPVRSNVKQDSLDPAGNKKEEIMIASMVQQSPVNRTPTSMVLTTEPVTEAGVKEEERREIVVQSYGPNLSRPAATQSQSPSPLTLKTAKGAGRGSRVGLTSPGPRAMLPTTQVVRGVQVQTTLTRLPQAEMVNAVRKPKVVSNVGVGAWTPGIQDIRHQVGPRPIIYQLASVNTSNSASNDSSNVNVNTINVVSNSSDNNISDGDVNQCVENADETRMLVLLPNGEKKLVRFPNTQQKVHINQLWQQVRFSLGSQISIVSNEQLPEKTTTGQLLIKGVALEDQEQQTTHDPSILGQITTGNVPNLGNTTSPTTAVGQQHRPRGVSPRFANSGAGNVAFRSRTQCNASRMPVPRVINQRMMSPPQHQQSQTVVTHNNSLSGAVQPQVQQIKDGMTPPQHPKEAPKFIPGQVAICPFCGISSLDFNKCIRCRRKLPPNVKSQSIFNAKKKKPEKASFSSEEALDNSKLDPDDKNTETSNSENKEKTGAVVTDKKKPKASPKKKKIADEPAEILILSSDEEEDNNQTKVEASRELPVISKEPVFEIMQLTTEEIAAAAKGHNLVDDLMENVQPGSYTTLLCRAVRIGSYKTQPKERLLISSKGIRLVVASLKLENTTIIIPCSEILKILVYFGKQMPIIFLYATPKMGFLIRSQLGMENKSGPYYDPTAQQEETHKRITFLLEKMTEDNKVALHNMFTQSKLMEELSEKETNEILLRASVDEQGVTVVKPTDAVKKIMIYPPPPEKGGIPLNNQDYACLGEDQFLNDVIIDFYLKYLLLKVLSPEDRERTHVFSTFFYKRLTTKPKTLRKNDPENDPKLTPAEKRHLRVKGWTKQVNLFEKDFIIVPINEHSHWFLAIICFPGLNGPVKFSDNSPVEPEEVAPKKSSRTVQIGNTTITHIVKTENSLSVEMDPGSDRDEAEGDQDDLHPSSDDEESEHVEEETQTSSTQVEIPLLSCAPQPSVIQSKETKGKPVRRKTFKEPIKQPCILIFDSLAGASRVRVVATLRDYLKIEYKKKMGHDREFTKDTIKGAVPKVPQQNNFTDCGLYVLQYVESFFQDPLHDFKLPLRYLQDWFPEEVVSSKRQELACLIRSLMEEQGIKVDEIGLPNLTFANDSTVGEEQAKLDEEEEEEEEGNGEEEEAIKGTAIASEVDNDEEEDMDIDEEDEDAEEAEDEDEDGYEELEMNELYKRNIHRSSPCSSEMETEGCQFTLTKCRPPGAYDSSGSDEDHFCCEDGAKIHGQNSIIISQFHEEVGEVEDHDGGRLIRKVHGVTEHKKSVPLTEFQDFESQISCTTIEKNFDTLTSESDMVISEGEEEEEVTNVENVVITETNSMQTLESEAIEFHDGLAKEKKVVDVTNVISKRVIVNEKSIILRRKEDGVGAKQLKGNCDKKADDGGEGVETDSRKVNSPCVKRSFEALKSVRIPKKAERAVFLTKRQRIDET